jgi:mannosyltransferase
MLFTDPVTKYPRKDPHLLLTVLTLGIVAAGATLRLHGLDRTSVFNDEAASWSMARQPFWDMLRATANDTYPPLYHVILFFTIRLFGDSEIALRLPSVIMGVANIYLLYRFGTVLWDRLTGLFAAALLALAAFHIWYSQEARMYALLTLAVTACALTTVLLIKRPTRLRAVLCGLASSASLYTHVYGIFDWASINVGVALAMIAGGNWGSADKRLWLTVQALVLLSFVPWMFVLMHQVSRVVTDFWIPFPTVRFLYWMARAISGGTPMLCVLAVLTLIALSSEIRNASSTKELAPRPPWSRTTLNLGWQNILLLSWAVLPFIAGYALSIITARPILYDRYLIGSLPPVLLLAAKGLSEFRPNRLVLTGAIATVFACGAPTAYRSVTQYQREDMRALIAPFSENFRISDAVVFSSAGVSNTFSYYYRKPVPLEFVMRSPRSDPFDGPDVTRLWVFARDGIENLTAPVFERIETRYVRQRTFHSYDMTLSLYELAEPSEHTPQPVSGAG